MVYWAASDFSAGLCFMALNLLYIGSGDDVMMLDRLLFSDKVPLMLKRSLDFQSQRHLLIASNISNLSVKG